MSLHNTVKITILFGLSFWMGQLAFAQKKTDPRFYVELEPLQFLNQGWSLVGHVAIQPRLQIGTNVFSSQLSEGLAGLAFNFSDELNLLAKQELGINVSMRYFLKKQDVQQGWVVSLPVGWENWTLSDRETGQEAVYQFGYLSPRIGYVWYPFSKANLYVLGEAVAILPIIQDDPVQLDKGEVSVRSFIPFPGLGIGYSF
ncbi:MAG: hypothetical protein AAFY71_07940 [Bacteroidota bacterium]